MLLQPCAITLVNSIAELCYERLQSMVLTKDAKNCVCGSDAMTSMLQVVVAKCMET